MGVGPSTKETSLHHFRDPILEVLDGDTDIDLLGIIIAPTSDEYNKKILTGRRCAQWIEAMRADGVIVSSDGWGNSHVDFENLFRELGSRGIPAAGITFKGRQSDFVVSNKYMDTIVDINKSDEGIETEVVGENSTDKTDARKAVAMLKLKIRKKTRE